VPLTGLVNMINCRRLDRKFNIFEGLLKNWYFMIIFAISTSSVYTKHT
jgi:Ca2+-transporting ATPase